MVREAFVDANLLVLLVVGAVDRNLISTNKRTSNFTPEDYDRLLALVEQVRVFVTPNTLTEASNLLKPHTRFATKLRTLIEGSTETSVNSADAARTSAFPRLGLTDAALLEVITPERPLVTVDLKLYAAAVAGGRERAFNFTHFRNP